jgi:hypothetical protein
VSEAGFMMDNETFQKIIGHFVELKDKIDGVKEELKTELKTDISSDRWPRGTQGRHEV